jgi:hypothetical protein
MEFTWSPSLIITILGLLAGGVGVWVGTNNKITRLETKVETLEKGHSDLHNLIRDGFDRVREEMKKDINSIKEYMALLIKKNDE